jgi:hypothetical protein
MTPIRILHTVVRHGGLRMKAVSLFVCLALVLISSGALALDDPRIPRARSHVVLPSDAVLGVAEEIDIELLEGVVPRVLDRIRRLPFRPVRIGERPRTPRDPDSGAGVVFKLRF